MAGILSRHGVKKVDVQRTLEEMGCDPIEAMASIVMDVNHPPELRLSAAKELAQYYAPKKKSIEVTGEDGGALKIQHSVHSVDASAMAQAMRILEGVGAEGSLPEITVRPSGGAVIEGTERVIDAVVRDDDEEDEGGID